MFCDNFYIGKEYFIDQRIEFYTGLKGEVKKKTLKFLRKNLGMKMSSNVYFYRYLNKGKFLCLSQV